MADTLILTIFIIAIIINLHIIYGEEQFRVICKSATYPVTGVYGVYKNNTIRCARICLADDACNYFATRNDYDCILGFAVTPCGWDTAGSGNWITFVKSGPLQVCNCNASMVPFQTSCYIFPPGTFTWQAGLAHCNSLGANMAEVEELSENGFLVQEATSRRYTKLWLGASDSAVEGSWVWNSGAPVTSTLWYPGEPNNSGDEDYMELVVGHKRWNDERITAVRQLVCELDCL